MQESELYYSIYELLSPRKNPERWQLYLELFDKHVLRLKMTKKELESARVFVDDRKAPEEDRYHMQFIENKLKRIDLLIITNKRFIPIEVKIDADDQPNQCRDYWREAEKYHETYSLSEPPVLYYLTPEGDFPSWESVGDIGYEVCPFIRSDKIDDVAFCSEGFSWIADCEDNPPKDIFQRNNLERLYDEIYKMANRNYLQRQVEEIMRKFFTALDNRFDENFCRKHHLKRGGNRRVEIGDCYTYKRFIDRFFGRAFSWPSICLYCTDSAGNVIKFDEDKELWFRVGCYNDRFSYLDESTAFCAGFMIFSHKIKQCLYKEDDIKPLLDGKNILHQEIIDKYDEKFNGLVGRTDLHDGQGNLIYFTDVDKTLTQFGTQEDIDRAVYNIMTEIEKLLERFVNEMR